MSKKQMKFLVLGLSLVFASSLACADEAGKVMAIEGRVDVLKLGALEAIPIQAGGVISSGDIVRTKSRSKAEIKFSDDTVLKLAENTRLEIEEYILDNGFRANAIISVQRGEIRAIVSKSMGDTNFFINTPNASGSAGDSDIYVFHKKSGTGILVNEGKVSIYNNAFSGQAIDVSKGFIAVIPPDEPPRDPRPYLDVEKSHHEAETTLSRSRVIDDPSQIEAVVTKLVGEARVRYGGTGPWAALKPNTILITKDHIETKETGMVEITLENGNIITLKANTSMMLTDLSRDSKTGGYVNLFEANIGNIRAKVEKLDADSKFEIKTPTAVCSVRGTTMYLAIIPGLTRVFFEGGNGIITSIISNITRIVQDGQTSSADDQGNVSDATEGDASEWATGWDTPEAEPYEEPGEGGLGEGGGEEGGTGEGGEAPDVPDTGDDPVVDVPPDSGDDNTPPPDDDSEEPLTFNGLWGEEDEGGGSLYGNNGGNINIDNPAGEEYGAIGSTTPGWGLGGPFPIVALGSYAAPGGRYIWNTPIFSYNESDGNNMTLDGGAFFGCTSGIWYEGQMDGSVAAFYAAPTGVPNTYNAGFLRGDIAGGYDPATSLWAVAGTLEPEIIEHSVLIPAGDFNDMPYEDEHLESTLLISGDFNGVGNIEGYIESEHTYSPYEDSNWGIYDFKFGDGNTYSNPDPDANTDWSGFMGSIEENEWETFYLLADLSNGTWEDGEIRADVDGTFIAIVHNGEEESFFGRLEGDFYGVNDVEGTWIGTTIGTWVEEDLEYGGVAEGSFGYVEDGEALFDNALNPGSMGFVFGGTDSAEGGPAPFAMIGEFDNPGGHTLWASDFNDWVSEDTKVLATMGGVKLGDLLEGGLIGLYIRDDGEGAENRYHSGYVASSDVEGNFFTMAGHFYDGIGMFNAEGNTSTYYDSPTEITPGELNTDEGNLAIEQEFTSGSIDGDFTGMFGVGSLAFEDQPWGIWRAGLSGEDGGPSSPFVLVLAGTGGDGIGDDDMYWLGTITGDGETGKMRGTFKGINIFQDEGGVIGADIVKGNIIGDYIDVDELPGTDSWQALGVGEWVEVTDLLTEENLGFTMAELENFILDVPITQTYASLLQGPGAFAAGGAIAGIMDMSIFNDQIWTALISGTYSGPTGDVWNMQLQDGSDIVNLAGDLWSEGDWLANVSGTVDGNEINGAAGGTYGDGEFQGAGAGTVETP